MIAGGRGLAVIAFGEQLFRIVFHRQAFVAQTDGVSCDHVDEVPGDVAGFVHRAQFRNGFGRGFVPHDAHIRVHFLIGLDIGLLLAVLVRTAPGDERHVVSHLHGVALGQCSAGSNGERRRCQKGLGQFHTVLPSFSTRFGSWCPGATGRTHGATMISADSAETQASSARQSSASQPISICSPFCRRR